MKPSLVAAVLFAQTLLSGGQTTEGQVPRAPQAWLGLRVAKPDEAITVHVPSIPPGVGFVVKSIDPGGPAQAAGLLELDLLWKFGDQMLVNEAQLATLLRLEKPGAEVVISGFRGGKPLEVKLKLGQAPVLNKPFSGEMVESAVLPGTCEGPMRVVNVAEKSASFSNDEGRAVVRRDGEIFKVKIDGLKGAVIFEGDLSDDAGLDHVPESWRRKIHVLCRTLQQTLDGGIPSQRQPRPRVVPPSPQKP
jgi:hypothetical protein